MHEKVQILSNFIAENSMKVFGKYKKRKTIVRIVIIRRAHRGIMLSAKMPKKNDFTKARNAFLKYKNDFNRQNFIRTRTKYS